MTDTNQPRPKEARSSHVLTINGGSSSLKFAVFRPGETLERVYTGRIERIGLPDATLKVGAVGGRMEERRIDAPKLTAAVELVVDWVEKTIGVSTLAAVGHRVVHGGRDHYRPERVTPELVVALRQIGALDPDHVPGEIEVIEAFQRLDSELLQVVCFDTAFHHDLPRVAQIVPIPRRYEAAGVRRYGFHGLSYTYLMEELNRVAGAEAAGGRVILAHLGSGASLAAVRGGHSVDTTMAFTPTAGLVMGTRSGDLDPGLVSYLARTEGMTPPRFSRLVNHDSGLLGISETSPDIRDLLGREHEDVRAAEAVAVFCYQARKFIGALAAALGGLDTIVFSGGIGENSPTIRARICAGLEFLGVVLEPARNEAADPIISAGAAAATVRVIRTDEELTIARATFSILGQPAANSAADAHGSSPV